MVLTDKTKVSLDTDIIVTGDKTSRRLHSHHVVEEKQTKNKVIFHPISPPLGKNKYMH